MNFDLQLLPKDYKWYVITLFDEQKYLNIQGYIDDFFGLYRLSFYLGRQDVYKFRLILSDYRCSQHPEGKNYQSHRKSDRYSILQKKLGYWW